MRVILAFMAANNASREIREWLRGQGETPSVRGSVSRRHMEMWWDAHPEQRPADAMRLLPDPDDDLDEYDDIGVLIPDAGAEPEPAGPAGPRRYEAVPDTPEPVTADPGPAHARKDWRKSAPKPGGRSRPGPVRVTAGVRNDINGKISFALEIPGRIWQARDPVCGGTFVEQREAIADALTGIVCQSADLIEFFTGTGAAFMLYLNLAAAAWPVVTVIMAHHVYHTIGEPEAPDMQAPDYGRYAA